MYWPPKSFQSHTSAFRGAEACEDAPGGGAVGGGSRKSTKVKVKGGFDTLDLFKRTSSRGAEFSSFVLKGEAPAWRYSPAGKHSNGNNWNVLFITPVLS